MDPRSFGRALRRAAPELTRVWRLARAQAQRPVFPGLLDGLVPSFLGEAGRLLVEGGDPGAAWGSTAGTLRLASADGGEELTVEWALLMEVLGAACESFQAEPAVGEWLAKAIAEAERGTAAVASGVEGAPLPPGVLAFRTLRATPPPERPPASPGG
jgi:hypothetical protein